MQSIFSNFRWFFSLYCNASFFTHVQWYHGKHCISLDLRSN